MDSQSAQCVRELFKTLAIARGGKNLT